MQAIRPSKPRLARFTIFGELTYRASSMVSRGRTSSIRCSSRTLAAMETMRQAAATRVVRCCELMGAFSELSSAGSFQVPALENENRTTQDHRRIEQRIQSVLQDQSRAHHLLVRDRADHVQSRK